jgi:hypothetical protein
MLTWLVKRHNSAKDYQRPSLGDENPAVTRNTIGTLTLSNSDAVVTPTIPITLNYLGIKATHEYF